jgi:serine protease AprX
MPQIARAGIRWRRLAGAVVGAGLLFTAVPAPDTSASVRPARVVVLEQADAGKKPRRAVRRLGGEVGRPLPLVKGFAAELPRTAVTKLRRAEGVRAVTADRRFKLLSDDDAAPSVGASLATARATVGASDAAGDGRGVDVAIVDSGVAPLPAFAGRLVDGPGLLG